jgi:hypothetical protein
MIASVSAEFGANMIKQIEKADGKSVPENCNIARSIDLRQTRLPTRAANMF